jgi:hypothetical protein
VRRWGGGRWAGHIQIEYEDGSSFFILPHEIDRAPRPPASRIAHGNVSSTCVVEHNVTGKTGPPGRKARGVPLFEPLDVNSDTWQTLATFYGLVTDPVCRLLQTKGKGGKNGLAEPNDEFWFGRNSVPVQ